MLARSVQYLRTLAETGLPHVSQRAGPIALDRAGRAEYLRSCRLFSRTNTRSTTSAIPAGQNSGRCTTSYQRPFSAPWITMVLPLTVVSVAASMSRLGAT